MPPGKVASQAGHAFLGAAMVAQKAQFEYIDEYLALSPGTKICLAGTLNQIHKAEYHAQRCGIPTFLVIDSGCKDFYDGQPIVTALGLGPGPSHILKPVAGKFRLHN